MKHREFVDSVLHMTKARYPELYIPHIKKRHAEFISENAPTKAVEELAAHGRRVGYAHKNLRLTWALARLFAKYVRDPLPKNAPNTATGTCLLAGEFASATITMSLYGAFWEFARSRFKLAKNEKLCLASDWSFFVLPRTPGVRTSIDHHFGVIACQMDIKALTSRVHGMIS